MTNDLKRSSARSPQDVVIGVDVGSQSARAGVFDLQGTLLAVAKQDITLFNDAQDHFEQSAEEIWQAVCHSVRSALAQFTKGDLNIIGMGFDATCSLVVVGEGGKPLAVGDRDEPERNVIVWMDHRATEQAERINATQHAVLKFVGNRISPEMETPKLLWLKEHRRQTYDNAWQFFDLVDYLTWRATGDLSRSMCTVTCKWTYLAHEQRWDADYFRQIGLNELADENFARIGTRVVTPGTACVSGLTETAAQQMGLATGIPVGVGMIDAHAGGIGTVGVTGQATQNMAYIFGTSSCTMTTTQLPQFVPGVWGPYYSAMVPDMWLSEGGQSAAGAAIDRLLASHPGGASYDVLGPESGASLPKRLADYALAEQPAVSPAIEWPGGVHVVPEFLGNRAPFANPQSRAVIAGLGMENDLSSLLALYVAGITSLGYGLKQIIAAQSERGIEIENIVISGGAGQHPFVRQLIADACDKPVIGTLSEEPVLLGAAMLGVIASGKELSLTDVMTKMNHVDTIYVPSEEYRVHHKRRFYSFELLQQSAGMLSK